MDFIQECVKCVKERRHRDTELISQELSSRTGRSEIILKINTVFSILHFSLNILLQMFAVESNQLVD